MRFACLLFCLLGFALPAFTQDQATLVADRVEIQNSSVLIAQGNIEVFYKGVRLTAQRITYDRASDRLNIDGPITLNDGEKIAIFASFAELSTDMQNGLLYSARLVLDQQLQLAAVEIARVNGRYTELSKVVASSCQVCAKYPTPLWSIRARRVIHDQEERQLYFEHAQFRVGDVPVLYVPRLRFPDPTLKRATGFLFPRLKSTSQLGTGLKLPYFITLGRSADVTVTPYLSGATTTFELRYRQAFHTGNIQFNGAVSRDDILQDQTRYYLFGEGSFNLPRDYKLSFDIQSVSDDAYLLDYGYSGADRLESNIAITRVRRDEYIEARTISLYSLRDEDVNSKQPSAVSEAYYERRFVPGALGGIATISADMLTSYRASNIDVDGRDIGRLRAGLAWERTGILGPGIQATVSARLMADFYDTRQDSNFNNSESRLIPETAVTLRWPLMKTATNGRTHILEPVAMLAWSPTDLDPVPNEDSTLSEFDEGNLLSFSRFPGVDEYEEGLRLALGMNWTMLDSEDRGLTLSFGRLFRSDDPLQFGTGTGLDGKSSDWLIALQFGSSDHLSFAARALFDDDFSVSKADFRMFYTDRKWDIETGFLYLDIAPSESRLDETTEWTLNTIWKIDPNWSANINWRYDFEAGRANTAGIGLGFKNECINMDLSLSRRFTSSTSVRPTTNIGLTVELTGFGTGRERGTPARRCVTYQGAN